MEEQKTKNAAQPRRHTQLSEFINSGNGSTLMGGCKQLSQFINSENASCAMNVAGVVNKESIPPAPLFKETPYPNPNGNGKGKGQDARACEASRKGKGQVGFRQMNGKGKEVVNREFFFNPLYDPVQIAIVGLGIPRLFTDANGKTYNHPRIMRWYIRIIGEECFRQLAYQQWRENAIGGEPNSRAAAFMAKLYAAKDEQIGGAK